MNIYDGPTKSERREKLRKKKREEMDKGKKLKLLDQLILRRAREAEQKLAERDRETDERP